MQPIKKDEAIKMLKELLRNTLCKQDDIDHLISIAEKSEGSIPMKAIRQHYDAMEKNNITAKDKDLMDTLMYFFGP